MNILITGGAGYKGVLLTQKLLNLGHKVTILDNFMYGFDSILHLIQNKNLSINKTDIRNLKESDVKDFDYIFATLKKYGAVHKLPYAWILKIGSV